MIPLIYNQKIKLKNFGGRYNKFIFTIIQISFKTLLIESICSLEAKEMVYFLNLINLKSIVNDMITYTAKNCMKEKLIIILDLYPADDETKEAINMHAAYARNWKKKL